MFVCNNKYQAWFSYTLTVTIKYVFLMHYHLQDSSGGDESLTVCNTGFEAKQMSLPIKPCLIPIMNGHFLVFLKTQISRPSSGVYYVILLSIYRTDESERDWASSWDYGTYHIGDQRSLRRACASAQSPQSLRYSHIAHMKYGSRRRVRSKIRHLAPTGWLCMRIWRMNLRRTKNATISWAGSVR